MCYNSIVWTGLESSIFWEMIKKSLLFSFLIVFGSTSAQKPVAFSWCFDKPLTSEDTLGLIMNKVKRIRAYELSVNDSNGKVPAYSFDTTTERSALFEWEVKTDGKRILVEPKRKENSDYWKITRVTVKNGKYTRYEYTNDKWIKAELYFKYTAWKDSAGVYTRAERSCSKVTGGKAENFGIIYKEEFLYENGSLKEIIVTFYSPAPNNKASGKGRLVFFYD
jgi:hypothetical protein